MGEREKMMWSRTSLKEKANVFLTNNYWMVVLISFISGIAANVVSNVYSKVEIKFDEENILYGANYSILNIQEWAHIEYIDFWGDTSIIQMTKELVVGIMGVSFLFFVLKIFVLNPLQIGCFKWFIYNRAEKPKFNMIADGFQMNYQGNVVTMFCRDLFIGLWS